MSDEKAKRESHRFNGLDLLLLVLVLAVLAALLGRTWIRSLFREEGSAIVTYGFSVAGVEGQTAAYLREGATLYASDGSVMGELLTCVAGDATDEQELPDGRTVRVRNGLYTVNGTVTATGYETNGFVRLNGGALLVPGETVYLSTADAFFAAEITSVRVSEP